MTQNGEELLRDAGLLRAIDGIAKEDLVYGNSGDETTNPTGDLTESVGYLNRAKRAGLPVFVVEYLDDAAKQAVARTRMAALGFPLLFAKRQLNVPPVDPLAPPPVSRRTSETPTPQSAPVRSKRSTAAEPSRRRPNQ